MTFATGKLDARLANKKISRMLKDIQAAWQAENYAGVVRRSRDLLQSHAGNTEALTYLARAGALTGDWTDVATAGVALARKSPKEAFVAAGKLNRAGRALDAAVIFCELDMGGDWFDAEAAELARKDAPLLIAGGEAAAQRGDTEGSAVIWAAGARIAPRSQVLAGKVRRLTRDLKSTLDRLEDDPAGYLNACCTIAKLNPASLSSAVRFARASEKSSAADAIDAWVRVLAIAPQHEVAKARLRSLSARHGLEDRAVGGLLVALGRDAASDPLICELADGRDARAKSPLDKQARLAAQKASRLKREVDPEAYLAAWKEVLAISPKDHRAARRVISGASYLRDYTALVDGWIAHLQITPDDATGADRLVGAALRAGQEPRVLDYLARTGLVGHLPKARLEVLYRRVLAAGRTAVRDLEFDLALACYETLSLVDMTHEGFEGLRSALANGLAATARKSGEASDQVTAVSLAEAALEIVPDHPAALTLVARDLWRAKRFDELVAFCKPRVKADPKYDAVHEMLEQAAFAA